MTRPMTESTDVDIQCFLEVEGFGGEALPRARAVLEVAGLTRRAKRRLVRTKLDQARAVLSSQLIRVCHRKTCRDVEDPRERVFVATANCELCGGSPNRRAGQLAREALLAVGFAHVLVLGGTPATHAALIEALAADALHVRCIDGKQGSRSAPTVEADLHWADVMVVWATTPLPHKVSRPYTTRANSHVPWITVARRGVEAVCDELVRLCANSRSLH
jgi:hypothetical protein